MTTTTSSGTAAMRPRLTSAEELLAHDRWPRDRLLAYQRSRLRELIEHAISNSAYYREVLGRDALDPDVRLEDLPALPKAMLMEQFDRVLADPRLRLDLLEAHAAGPDPGTLMPGARTPAAATCSARRGRPAGAECSRRRPRSSSSGWRPRGG